MLLSEIIYNIKNLITGNSASDDEVLSDKQLAFIINYYRARLIKNDDERSRAITETSSQILGKVPIIQADANECCIIEDCILRTTNKIPLPLETGSMISVNISGVGGLPFQQTNLNALAWNCGAKYTRKEPKWYYQNGYIYLINPPTLLLEEIVIDGLFSDPTEANRFKTCDCPNNALECNAGFDYEYPIAPHYIDVIVKMFMNAEYKFFLNIIPDKENDSQSQLEQRA